MGFLFSAFVAVWLLVMVYVVFIGLRQRKLEDEIRTLEEVVDER